MAGKVFIFLAILLLQFSAHGQWMQEPLRVQDPKYTLFFIEKMSSWFDKNIYSFSKNLNAEEKKLLEIYLKNQKTFGYQGQGYFLRAFSYGVHFSPTKSGRDSRVFTLEIFNTEKNQEIQKQILKLAQNLDAQKLQKADLLGFRTSSDGSRWLLLFNKESTSASIEEIPINQKNQKKSVRKLGIKTSDFCVGLIAGEKLQKDLQTFENSTESKLLCHSVRFEAQAWGPEAEKISAQFLKGLNLQPGMIQHIPEKAALYYP